MAEQTADIEFIEEENDPLDPRQVARFGEAVLYSLDWTVQTVLDQLQRNNIELNPRFQRRDAWGVGRKSQFIESIFLGLPIPQIVLAERKDRRGSFIVLDGKQRLLTLLQFIGEATSSENNAFKLRGLEALKDLRRKSNIACVLMPIGFSYFKFDPLLIGKLDSLGTDRGQYVHKGKGTYVTSHLDPQAEFNKVRELVRELAKMDNELDDLLAQASLSTTTVESKAASSPREKPGR